MTEGEIMMSGWPLAVFAVCYVGVLVCCLADAILDIWRNR